MPRLPRLHVPGGYFHVYARGNGKQDIFLDSNDRLRWEYLLHEGLQQHNHQIHAYCWMTNHVHIAIQAGEKPLSRFVGSLLSRYAKQFNRKTGRSGHVFERRYGSIPVHDDSYLRELIRYIHQNPKRAGIVNGIGDYRWSSHRAYMGDTRTPWLTPETVLSLFGANLQAARRQYVEFVGEKQPTSVVEQIRNGSTIDNKTLGHETWVNAVLRRADTIPEFESLDQLIDEVCCRNGVSEAQLASASRARANARLRAEIAMAAMDLGLATLTDTARRFGRSLPVLSSAVCRLRRELHKRNINTGTI